MKTLTKLFMLATLMVNSTTVWAASSGESTPEQTIEQAYNNAIIIKNKLKGSTIKSKVIRSTLTKQYAEDVKNLESACGHVCKPAAAGKEKFCEQHCTFDKHGHPAEYTPAEREEEHKGAAA